MKYILRLAACCAFAFGPFASGQNADLQDKDIVASHRQGTGATSTSRGTVRTPRGHGAPKSGYLDQQLAYIERQSVKSGTGKPVRHPSSHVAKSAETDAQKTKSINFGQRNRATTSKGSNNR